MGETGLYCYIEPMYELTVALRDYFLKLLIILFLQQLLYISNANALPSHSVFWPDGVSALLVLALIFITIAVIRFSHKGSSQVIFGGTLLPGNGFFNMKQTLVIFIPLVFMLAIMFTDTIYFSSQNFTGNAPLNSLLAPVFFLLLSAFWEELTFRGPLFRSAFYEVRKNHQQIWPFFTLIAIHALVFTLFHLRNPQISGLTILNIFLASAVLGFASIHSFFSVVLLHFFWNIIPSIWWGLPVSGYTMAPSYMKPVQDLPGWESTFYATIAWALPLLFYIFFWLGKHRAASALQPVVINRPTT